MSRLKTSLAAAAVTAGLGLATASSQVLANESFITIGTGGVTGVYYPTGGAICRLVNRNRSEHGIRCSVESTGGSAYNVNTIRAGELDFGVAQSDVQYNAYRGEAQFEDAGAYEDLRAVFSIHPEAFTVVARADANATEFDDLEGKRVNVGNPGSGQRSTVEQLQELRGQSMDIYAQAADLRAAEMSSALCDNRIDAMIYVVGHPSGSIKEATSSCDSRLVNVRGDYVDELLAEYPYYRRATIPGGEYAGNPDPVETFGVAATLVTTAETPDEQVYQLVKAVFDNFDTFTRLHPAFAGLEKEDMVRAGLSAPLHPGAERYYREAGLID
ncbi:TAXI family TRAP transporter solute-binding subunit [Marinospirillum perlucidum]|uniref:TAXI family TRAP transporter solute-binding subunit n=1 Tax=Marinospirillum perlucidum TaxID=1982602 RepID=UPI000DF4A804|nr:TAXI family TRAP transporter solute-binding subunit [Marinospirillum perlucidum]